LWLCRSVPLSAQGVYERIIGPWQPAHGALTCLVRFILASTRLIVPAPSSTLVNAVGLTDRNFSMNDLSTGPLPLGFRPPSKNVSGSILSGFTKRLNWSQYVLEGLPDLLHVLNLNGRILYVSPSCKAITGYEPAELIGCFLCEFVHPDDSGIFLREFNTSIASGNPLRFFYRFRKADND
jgi:PAS domain-containing protein